MNRNTITIHAPAAQGRVRRREGYARLMRHPQWRALRERILQRDSHRCRHCGSGDQLHVHHRQYHIDARSGRLLLPWAYADTYLLTLCATCHETGHRHYRVPCFSVDKPH